MIVVDTSVWIDHLRRADPRLRTALARGEAGAHPAVVGELALGRIAEQDVVLRSLRALPRPLTATDEEVLGLVARHRLGGAGVGWVDAHLVAAVLLTPDARLWTRDRRLAGVAERIGVPVDPD